MQPEGSLPHHNKLPPVPTLNESDPVYDSNPFRFLNMHYNIILQSTPRSTKCTSSSGFLDQNLHTSFLPHIYVTSPTQLILPIWENEKCLIIGEDNLIILNVSSLRTPRRLGQSMIHPKLIRKVSESNLCCITGYSNVFRGFL